MTYKMVNDELNFAIAKRKGWRMWHRVRDGKSQYYVFYGDRPRWRGEWTEIDYNGDFWYPKDYPQYIDNPTDTIALLKELRQEYFSTHIYLNDYTDKVTIVCHARQGHDENIPDAVIESTFERAICEAWLWWVENKERDEHI